MGGYEHRGYRRQFRLGQNLPGRRDCQVSQPALGHHSLHSIPTPTHYSGEESSDRLQDSFYKSLTPEQNRLAHANEYDLDSPKSIDFDLLVEKLKELKQG